MEDDSCALLSLPGSNSAPLGGKHVETGKCGNIDDFFQCGLTRENKLTEKIVKTGQK